MYMIHIHLYMYMYMYVPGTNGADQGTILSEPLD